MILKTWFYIFFWFTVAVTITFISVAGAASGNTRSAFSNDFECEGSGCDAIDWATGALYFSVLTLVVVAVTNIVITMCFLCSTAVFTNAGGGYAYGLSVGLSGYSAIADVLVSSQLLGNLRFFESIDRVASEAGLDLGWNETMYQAAAGLGVIACAFQLLVTGFLLCCGSKIGAAAQHGNLGGSAA